MGWQQDKWSEEDTKLVIEQWGQMSAGQISRMCKDSHSRNAVIGKAHRLGLPGKVEKRARIPNLRRSGRIRVSHSGRYGHPRLIHSRGILPPNVGEEAVELPVECRAVGKTFMDLGFEECRWPMQDLFCGARTVKRSSYCPYHALMSIRGRKDAVQRSEPQASPPAREASEASGRTAA